VGRGWTAWEEKAAVTIMKNFSSDLERVRAKLKIRAAEFLNSRTAETLEGRQAHALKDFLRQVLKTFSPEERRILCISRTKEEDRFLDGLITETLGLGGPLDELLRDPTVSEIMVNGPRDVFAERAGRLQRVEVSFRDTNHLLLTIERMLEPLGLSVNESNACCDASLPDGSRLNVIIPPLALNGPVVTIRRKLRGWTMPEYLQVGALDEQAAQFLEACVRAKVNMVFSGGTSTGKTTLVAILSRAIPVDERVITIENVAELELPERAHWIRLVAKMPNAEGHGEVPLRTLVKNALRMRPDRIILGEARGGEALDVVQAMHSGHDGFLAVLHANSPTAALERLQTLMLMSGLDMPPSACQMQIASAVDLVVHMARFVEGSRRIASITQVLGASKEGFQMEDLFTFDPQGFSPEGRLQGVCRFTGARPKFLRKFEFSNVPVPSWMTT
jgi:pilus assembly protein CpaF